MGNLVSTQDGKTPNVKRISENVDDIVHKQEIMKKTAEELCKLIEEQDSSVKELRLIKNELSAIFVTEGQNMYLKQDCKCCMENKEHLEQEKKKNIALESGVTSLKTKMDQKEKEYRHLERHAQLLKENNSTLKEENIRYGNEYHRMKEEIDSKENENHRMKQEIDCKEKENHRMKQEIDFKEKENHRMKQEIHCKENEIRQLNERCHNLEERLRQRDTVHVLLYCAVQQKLMNEVSSELQTILTTHMDSQGYCLQIDICHNPQHRPPGLPLIVLCINASRLGTDVSQALQHVPYEHSVAVVVLHNKKLHALPSQSSERLLVGGNYKQLGQIVDIAYVAGDGMYACDMNNNALTKLCYFIKNFK